ncbi:MAG: 23S rRNA (pseudouridine(1915)-N(3))-methyltransferase RlmH [Alphaproteobacteria bacterium]|jgi:23S rRNA (pseudouridine1915-N3)-methyltransferase|nr:23S rRNA (pseudouridine(1915)-N(3))-methyltransferase RlmH [Alphaproteobacteria bacterium]
MNITVIAASRVKSDSHVGKLIAEYAKRFTTVRLNMVDFDEKNLSQQKINEKIFTLIKPNSYKILLDERGANPSTMQLKNFLSDIDKPIAFLIAGSDGFLPEYKKQADYMLSLSSLTFPHQIARLLLVEQLYRVQSIIQGHPYHRT